jgi:hypothetical protein
MWWYWPGIHANWFETANPTTDIHVMAKYGQFGDMFGAVNALFTGLGFVGVLATLLLHLWLVKHQADQFVRSQEKQGQSNQLNSMTMLLSRVDDLLDKAVDAKNPLELEQRKNWSDERKFYEEQVRKISKNLGVELPETALQRTPDTTVG